MKFKRKSNENRQTRTAFFHQFSPQGVTKKVFVYRATTNLPYRASLCHQVKPKPRTPPNRTQLQLPSFSPQPLARYSLCIPSPFSAFLRHPWAPRYTRTRWNPDVSGILEGPGTPEQAQTVPRTSYCASPSLGPCPKSSHSPTPNQHQHGVKHTENSSFLPSKEA